MDQIFFDSRSFLAVWLCYSGIFSRRSDILPWYHLAIRVCSCIFFILLKGVVLLKSLGYSCILTLWWCEETLRSYRFWPKDGRWVRLGLFFRISLIKVPLAYLWMKSNQLKILIWFGICHITRFYWLSLYVSSKP